MRRNYQLVYIIRKKCGNYRDTSVSKKEQIMEISQKYFVSSIITRFYFPKKKQGQKEVSQGCKYKSALRDLSSPLICVFIMFAFI